MLNHPPDYTPPDQPSAEAELPPAQDRPLEDTQRTSADFEYPTASVIVLNYNGLRHLEDCFTSLLALDYPKEKLELIMVDNGSSDGSVDYVREHFPTVRVLETGENLGFAAGNDYGAERATGEYVAFLNNDTRVEPRWLAEMVASVVREVDRGVVCTSSLMLDWSGEMIDFQAGAVNFHGFGFQPSYGQPVAGRQIEPRELLFACGGSMLIRRDVFLEAGGFDPDYFAFFEDVDLGWRLWVLGYRVTLTPTAVTYHRHHGTASEIPGHRTYVLYERNALYTIYKNYEQEHLDRILPVALLLLGQRMVRFVEMGGTDLADYDLAAGLPGSAPAENVHRNVVSGLLAVNEFSDNLDKMNRKRAWIQANRKRSDEELFALFGRPGHANLWNHSTDAPYAAAHHALSREFGLDLLWSHVPKEVLVISPDVLPVGEIPATGSGIRAWALGQGLKSRGHHVHYTMPAPALQGREAQMPVEYVVGAWTTRNLQTIVDGLSPDVVLSCGWPNLTWVERANVPTVIDLTGPHLLERAFQGHQDLQTNTAEKLRALALGDFFSCIGERQKYYFEAWLAQAGLTMEELSNSLQVIPYSMDPEQPEHLWPDGWQDADVHFVYGGIFLPWQNPALALLTVASTLQSEGRGILEVIGGKHPFYPVEVGEYGPLVEQLTVMPRVRMTGLLPHDALVERYRRAHVAVDVLQPNAERELAFPSRTVHYLWCGLPVIHAEFSEVARHIADYEAGWVVPHDRPVALAEVVRDILADPDEARRRGENAQRLARDRFSWDRTVETLDEFVRRPYIRPARSVRRAAGITRAAAAGADGLARASAVPWGTAESSDNLVVANTLEARLPEKVQRLQEKRRSVRSQLAARSVALLKELVPVPGTRLRPKVVEGQLRFALSELASGHSHGQRFRCPRDGLSGIRIQVGTFGRRNTARLTLHLRSNPAGYDLFSLEVPTYRLKDGQTLAFRFPPIADSANRFFYFVAESPDGTAGDAITLSAVDRPERFEAQRYEDGLPAKGALVMTLEFDGVTA